MIKNNITEVLYAERDESFRLGFVREALAGSETGIP